jgi:hypothetical protein
MSAGWVLRVSSDAEIHQIPEQHPRRYVSFLLALSILAMPYVFGWLTLRKGHSPISGHRLPKNEKVR